MTEDARRIYRRFAWGFVAAGASVIAGFLVARAVGSLSVDGRPETIGAFLMIVGEALRRTVRADEMRANAVDADERATDGIDDPRATSVHRDD